VAGGEVRPGRSGGTPKQFGAIYGFALADVDGEGKPKVLVLDHLDYLHMSMRGTEIYGVATASRIGADTGVRWTRGENRAAGFTEAGDVQGRMHFQDILGNGKKQLILPGTPRQPVRLSNPTLRQGKDLWPELDGVGMQPVWETREVPGYIADHALIDPDGSGNKKLILLVVQRTCWWAKGRSSVVVLNLRPPD